MKIVFTTDPYQKIRSNFLNLNLYSVINIDNVMLDMGYDNIELNRAQSYLVNTSIRDAFVSALRSKRLKGIIYINKNLNANTIKGIMKMVSSIYTEGSVFDSLSFAVIDNSLVPNLKHTYDLVDEVIFYTTISRVRSIDCVPFPDHIFNQTT